MTTAESNQTKQRIFATGQSIIASKGFTAVGLNELLKAAKVPKGSFYHYFDSKDAFGTALLERYFDDYLENMNLILQPANASGYHALMRYWQQWIANQTTLTECGKCLAVKLGAEVADLSEPMRKALDLGTSRIIERLTTAIRQGVEEGSVGIDDQPERVASRLYALWLGASVMAKITRSSRSFDEVLAHTRHLLNANDFSISS
ncbi:MAG: TetR/AcrR family transcriptional regulator [Pseudomonas sp.]